MSQLAGTWEGTKAEAEKNSDSSWGKIRFLVVDLEELLALSNGKRSIHSPEHL